MLRLSAALLLICAACGEALPTLEGMDIDRWREDKNACRGHRREMEQALVHEKDKLKGLSEMDVVELLGRPDKNELYKRNQKFFCYYVSPGPDCDKSGEQPVQLIIRFNAMGYAQLVSVGTHEP